MGILTDLMREIFPPGHPPLGQKMATPSPTGRHRDEVAPTVDTERLDVAAALDARVRASGEPLDWRHSLHDLLAAAELDASEGGRAALAHELRYPGALYDVDTRDAWLHREVMTRLQANGGKVPPELLH